MFITGVRTQKIEDLKQTVQRFTPNKHALELNETSNSKKSDKWSGFKWKLNFKQRKWERLKQCKTCTVKTLDLRQQNPTKSEWVSEWWLTIICSSTKKCCEKKQKQMHGHRFKFQTSPATKVKTLEEKSRERKNQGMFKRKKERRINVWN